jgi:hypothetical protein
MPFESHTGSAQALPSLPPGNKKTASWAVYFIVLAEAVRFDAKKIISIESMAYKPSIFGFVPTVYTKMCTNLEDHNRRAR